MNRRFAMLFLGLTLLPLLPAAAAAEEFHSTRAPVPAFECTARVAYDRDMMMPGYILPTSAGPRTCIPFSSAAAHPPAGYRGDFYVDEFTDQKLRERWYACDHNKACHKRVFDQVMKRHPPNVQFALADEHKRFLLGKIDEKGGDTDLTSIRRPAFFDRAPYNEPIAADDGRTWIVEFTAPREAYERIHEHMTGDIKIRGWYIRGDGI
ncbi:MAG TPA: hypothetical protein VEM35_05000, partial [Rhizomicrobium sp.]|nr:hypothetical protein [Rhizomicrobium sp.]